nr:hypothetical protein [Tanacetum cinerariifolium]
METKYGLWVLIMAFVSTSYAKLDSIVKHVFDNFDFKEESGFLQFWECCASGDLEDAGCNLFLTDQSRFAGICNNRLKNFRRTCLNNNYRFVGLENVGNWFAGRAAQTRVADYQHDGEASGMGQLVVPVYHPGAVLKLVGIIELVTDQRNDTYAADFNRIQSSLMEVNLTSTYLGKTIKVEYDQMMIKFPLPFSAKLRDLQEQVRTRFKNLENKAFSIAYKDTNLNHHLILNDRDLQFCITESILNRKTLIRMVIEDVAG